MRLRAWQKKEEWCVIPLCQWNRYRRACNPSASLLTGSLSNACWPSFRVGVSAGGHWTATTSQHRVSCFVHSEQTQLMQALSCVSKDSHGRRSVGASNLGFQVLPDSCRLRNSPIPSRPRQFCASTMQCPRRKTFFTRPVTARPSNRL